MRRVFFMRQNESLPLKDNNMSDFSINEMQEMQKAGKMRTEKQKTGIVWDSHRRTKVKNRKLRGEILSL